MNITIWGCRGSIPTPGPQTVRYGGESTCIEVVTDENRRFIIDAGSGIRHLGKKLIQIPGEQQITLLLTHAHWDHLSGFPFFLPAYSPRFTINICGGDQARQSVLSHLAHQMTPPYFPVDFSVLKAHINPGCMCDNHACVHNLPGTEDNLICDSIPLNHPGGGFGFKFRGKSGVFVFLTDNEIRYRHPGGLERQDYIDFCRNASLLLHDAQYLETEYQKTLGWGHSTIQDAVDLALEADVKRLVLVHHDPDRTDDELDHLLEWYKNYIARKGGQLDLQMGVEGLNLIVY